MKGIVFTELIDMVENKFSPDLMDDVLDDCNLESGGAYTTVGTYSHLELIEIVKKLSAHSKIPVTDLIKSYGYHLFKRFHILMPQFFINPKNAFDFLESVHGYIHVEVKKLYPDAALPGFETIRPDNETLIMTYTSHCPFADFAEGLIKGCIDFYNENVTIETIDENTEKQFCRIFTLTRHDG